MRLLLSVQRASQSDDAGYRSMLSELEDLERLMTEGPTDDG